MLSIGIFIIIIGHKSYPKYLSSSPARNLVSSFALASNLSVFSCRQLYCNMDPVGIEPISLSPCKDSFLSGQRNMIWEVSPSVS